MTFIDLLPAILISGAILLYFHIMDKKAGKGHNAK